MIPRRDCRASASLRLLFLSVVLERGPRACALSLSSPAATSSLPPQPPARLGPVPLSSSHRGRKQSNRCRRRGRRACWGEGREPEGLVGWGGAVTLVGLASSLELFSSRSYRLGPSRIFCGNPADAHRCA